jgi:lambda family phage portal protein
MSLLEKIAPQWALNRAAARLRLSAIKNYAQAGAASNGNWAKGLQASANSPNDDITENLETITARARYSFRANPLASGPIKKMRTNVVGSGLLLNPKPDAAYLGLTDEQAEVFEQTVKREFAVWAKSKDCDMSRRLTFGQQQGLVFLSALVNGDVFAALPVKPRAGQPYDLRVQLIEADRVRTPSEKSQDKNVKAGIRTNDDGEAISAFIASGYEGDMDVTFTEVPFYGDSGTPLLLQVAQDWERVGQIRGVSVLAPIMEVLVQLDRYTKAELMANVVSSMLTVFVKSENGVGSLADGVPIQDQVDAGNDDTIELGNGSVVGLAAGEDISVVNPARTNSSFDSVMTAYIRQLGVGLEMPYEVLIAHFQSSYSAARGALQEAWKMYLMRREWLVETFCQPIYEQWLAEAVAKGRVQANGFFDDPAVRAAWCGAKWIGPAQSSLNPAQEANAAEKRIQIGISTRGYESQITNGMTFDEVNSTLAREYAQRKRSGLEPDNSGVDNE